jgi:hypothetical protein
MQLSKIHSIKYGICRWAKVIRILSRIVGKKDETFTGYTYPRGINQPVYRVLALTITYGSMAFCFSWVIEQSIRKRGGKKEQNPSFSALEHAASQLILLSLRSVGLGDKVGIALQRPV